MQDFSTFFAAIDPLQVPQTDSAQIYFIYNY